MLKRGQGEPLTAPAHDPGLDLPPSPQPSKLAGVDLDPTTGQANARAPMPSTKDNLGMALAGLRAMQPPTIPPPQTPAAPHPDVRALAPADPVKLMQMIQALSHPSGGAMLNQLLGRGG